MAISPNPFFSTVWPGLAVWNAFYISHYYLTLTCARLYRTGVSDKIVFEGSFEITPYFQRDIDSLKANQFAIRLSANVECRPNRFRMGT